MPSVKCKCWIAGAYCPKHEHRSVLVGGVCAACSPSKPGVSLNNDLCDNVHMILDTMRKMTPEEGTSWAWHEYSCARCGGMPAYWEMAIDSALARKTRKRIVSANECFENTGCCCAEDLCRKQAGIFSSASGAAIADCPIDQWGRSATGRPVWVMTPKIRQILDFQADKKRKAEAAAAVEAKAAKAREEHRLLALAAKARKALLRPAKVADCVVMSMPQVVYDKPEEVREVLASLPAPTAPTVSVPSAPEAASAPAVAVPARASLFSFGTAPLLKTENVDLSFPHPDDIKAKRPAVTVEEELDGGSTIRPEPPKAEAIPLPESTTLKIPEGPRAGQPSLLGHSIWKRGMDEHGPTWGDLKDSWINMTKAVGQAAALVEGFVWTDEHEKAVKLVRVSYADFSSRLSARSDSYARVEDWTQEIFGLTLADVEREVTGSDDLEIPVLIKAQTPALLEARLKVRHRILASALSVRMDHPVFLHPWTERQLDDIIEQHRKIRGKKVVVGSPLFVFLRQLTSYGKGSRDAGYELVDQDSPEADRLRANKKHKLRPEEFQAVLQAARELKEAEALVSDGFEQVKGKNYTKAKRIYKVARNILFFAGVGLTIGGIAHVLAGTMGVAGAVAAGAGVGALCSSAFACHKKADRSHAAAVEQVRVALADGDSIPTQRVCAGHQVVHISGEACRCTGLTAFRFCKPCSKARAAKSIVLTTERPVVVELPELPPRVHSPTHERPPTPPLGPMPKVAEYTPIVPMRPAGADRLNPPRHPLFAKPPSAPSEETSLPPCAAASGRYYHHVFDDLPMPNAEKRAKMTPTEAAMMDALPRYSKAELNQFRDDMLFPILSARMRSRIKKITAFEDKYGYPDAEWNPAHDETNCQLPCCKSEQGVLPSEGRVPSSPPGEAGSLPTVIPEAPILKCKQCNTEPRYKQSQWCKEHAFPLGLVEAMLAMGAPDFGELITLRDLPSDALWEQDGITYKVDRATLFLEVTSEGDGYLYHPKHYEDAHSGKILQMDLGDARERYPNQEWAWIDKNEICEFCDSPIGTPAADPEEAGSTTSSAGSGSTAMPGQETPKAEAGTPELVDSDILRPLSLSSEPKGSEEIPQPLSATLTPCYLDHAPSSPDARCPTCLQVERSQTQEPYLDSPEKLRRYSAAAPGQCWRPLFIPDKHMELLRVLGNYPTWEQLIVAPKAWRSPMSHRLHYALSQDESKQFFIHITPRPQSNVTYPWSWDKNPDPSGVASNKYKVGGTGPVGDSTFISRIDWSVLGHAEEQIAGVLPEAASVSFAANLRALAATLIRPCQLTAHRFSELCQDLWYSAASFSLVAIETIKITIELLRRHFNILVTRLRPKPAWAPMFFPRAPNKNARAKIRADFVNPDHRVVYTDFETSADLHARHLSAIMHMPAQEILTRTELVKRVNKNPYVDMRLSHIKQENPYYAADYDLDPDWSEEEKQKHRNRHLAIDGLHLATPKNLAKSLERYGPRDERSIVTDQDMRDVVDALYWANPELYGHAELIPNKRLIKNWKGSPGYPLLFIRKKGDLKDPAQPWLGDRAPVPYLVSEIIRGADATFQQDRYATSISHVFPKSQVVTMKKFADKGYGRSILGVMMTNQIRGRRFHGDINDRRDPWHSPGKPGMPMTGRAFNRLYLNVCNRKWHYALDGTNYDSTIKRVILDTSKLLRKKGFQWHPDYSKIATALDAIEDSVFHAHLVNLIAARDSEYRHLWKHGGIMTGHESVTEDNTETLQIAMLLTLNKYWKLKGRNYTMEDTLKMYDLENVGDDNFLHLDEELDEKELTDMFREITGVQMKFDNKQQEVTGVEFLSKTGHDLTDADREELRSYGVKDVEGLKYKVTHAEAPILFRYVNLRADVASTLSYYKRSRRVDQFVATHLARTTGYMSLCAHHKGVYDFLSGEYDHHLNSLPPSSRAAIRRLHPRPTYEKVMKDWYAPIPETENQKYLVDAHLVRLDYINYRAYSVDRSLRKIKRRLFALDPEFYDIPDPQSPSRLPLPSQSHLEGSARVAKFIWWRAMESLWPTINGRDENSGVRPMLSPHEFELIARASPFYGIIDVATFYARHVPGLERELDLQPFGKVYCKRMATKYRFHMFLLSIAYSGLNLGLAALPAGFLSIAPLCMDLYFGGLRRVYSYLGYGYWMDQGRGSQIIANLTPKDPYGFYKYIASKVAALVPEALEVPDPLAGMLPDTSAVLEAFATILGTLTGSSSRKIGRVDNHPVAEAGIKANPWSGIAAEVLSLARETPGKALILDAPTASGKTYYFPQAVLDRTGPSGVRYNNHIVLVPTRVLAETVSWPAHLGGYRSKRGRNYTGGLSVMTYGHARATWDLITQNCSPGDTVIQLDEYHFQTPDLLLVNEWAKQAGFLRIISTATPRLTRDREAYPTYRAQVKGAFPVETLRVKCSPTYAFHSLVQNQVAIERGYADRILIIHPSEKECQRIVDDIAQRKAAYSAKGINFEISVVSRSRPKIPETGHIVATQMVDAGVTINGVSAVIDAGLSMVSHCGTLQMVEAPKSVRIQRRGRTGRTRVGIYIDCGQQGVEPEEATILPDPLDYLINQNDYKSYYNVDADVGVAGGTINQTPLDRYTCYEGELSSQERHDAHVWYSLFSQHHAEEKYEALRKTAFDYESLREGKFPTDNAMRFYRPGSEIREWADRWASDYQRDMFLHRVKGSPLLQSGRLSWAGQRLVRTGLAPTLMRTMVSNWRSRGDSPEFHTDISQELTDFISGLAQVHPDASDEIPVFPKAGQSEAEELELSVMSTIGSYLSAKMTGSFLTQFYQSAVSRISDASSALESFTSALADQPTMLDEASYAQFDPGYGTSGTDL